MTSSLQQQHVAKFRWTEQLTWHFIELRRDHAKMFTGRKYSAQQGWEYILRQMRQKFPAVMAEVHYRVLKKKWSNLLQQYKELKNSVHGDKNRADDDISWPFYSLIDGFIASPSLQSAAAVANNNNSTLRRRRCSSSGGRRSGASYINDNDDKHLSSKHMKNERVEEDEEDDDDDEDLNPQEFLCVSVSPDNVTPIDYDRLLPSSPQREHRSLEEFGLNRHTRRSLLSRLPRATELSIRPAPAKAVAVKRKHRLGVSRLSTVGSSDEEEEARQENGTAAGNSRKRRHKDEGLERRIVEFMEYAQKRDEENRSILMRMLEALQDIRNALG